MADLASNSGQAGGAPPVTEDVFMNERQNFWAFFTGLVTKAAIGVAVLLILLAIFLV